MKTIYEDDRFIGFTQGALRPGGTELTCSLVKESGLRMGAKILDVCCGLGESTEALSQLGYNAKGVDISDKLISKGQALGRNIYQGNAYELSGQYDALLYECAFSLLKDKDRALSSAANVLPQGGLILLSDLYPRQKNSTPSLNCSTCVNGVLPLKTLIDYMEASGFSLIYFKDQSGVFGNFLSILIMEYGSLAGFFAPFIGDCYSSSAIESMENIKLGYFESIWEKK